MADVSETGGNSDQTYQDQNAIYHHVSPHLVLGLKFAGGITGIMIIISLIISLAQGSHDNSNYLLTTNLVISAIVGGMMAWWYRTEVLLPDKIWFLFLVCGVIIFQCITIDIYGFHSNPQPIPTPTTVRPNVTITPATIKP